MESRPAREGLRDECHSGSAAKRCRNLLCWLSVKWREGDLGARFQIVGGNFFDSVPADADAYLLRGVLHDWPDDDAVRILRNTRAAIRSDGTLLLIENIVDSATRPADLIDLLMLVICGRERTEADFRSGSRPKNGSTSLSMRPATKSFSRT